MDDEETKQSFQAAIPLSHSFVFLTHEVRNEISLKQKDFPYFHHFYYAVLASPKK